MPFVGFVDVLSSPISIFRLIVSEIQARRSNGYCYNGDERYAPNHRYKTRNLLLLLSKEYETNPLIETITINELLLLSTPFVLVTSPSTLTSLPSSSNDQEPQPSFPKSFHMPMNVVACQSFIKTLQFCYTIVGQPIYVPVDA